MRLDGRIVRYRMSEVVRIEQEGCDDWVVGRKSLGTEYQAIVLLRKYRLGRTEFGLIRRIAQLKPGLRLMELTGGQSRCASFRSSRSF